MECASNGLWENAHRTAGQVPCPAPATAVQTGEGLTAVPIERRWPPCSGTTQHDPRLRATPDCPAPTTAVQTGEGLTAVPIERRWPPCRVLRREALKGAMNMHAPAQNKTAPPALVYCGHVQEEAYPQKSKQLLQSQSGRYTWPPKMIGNADLTPPYFLSSLSLNAVVCNERSGRRRRRRHIAP